MLILSRKKNQSIILNGNIEITIIDNSNDQVKIGISAPKEISVYRKELYDQIKKEMQRASLKSTAKIPENFPINQLLAPKKPKINPPSS